MISAQKPGRTYELRQKIVQNKINDHECAK